MSSGTRILVVEDAPDVREMICGYLEVQGYAVQGARTGAEAMELAAATPPQAVVLDIGLPDIDGLTVMARLRAQHPQVGIIVVTARGAEFDLVTGLEAGADSYIRKPLNLRVLLAHLRSLLRRCGGVDEEATRDMMLAIADFRVDLLRRRIFDGKGQELALTPGEFALLIGLIERRGKPVSRQILMDCMRIGAGSEDMPDLRTIDTLVARLRRKLSTPASKKPLIQTVYGKGYRLAAEEQ